MHSLFRIILISFTAGLSLSENSVEFDERWITRPPVDKEFPYSVYIKMMEAEDEGCSGTLITEEWVLTAARCMYGRDQRVVENDTSLTVYAGVDNKLEDPHVQQRASSKLVIHDIPGKDSYFSLALIKLKSQFYSAYKGKRVRPLDIVKYDEFWDKNMELVCKSGSFGRLDWNTEKPPALKKTLTLVQSCNCSSALQQAFPNSSTDQWLCGESENNLGICKGDFGTALQCDLLVAIPINIVTFADHKTCLIQDKTSKRCMDTNSVSIYLDVCYHSQWIHTHVPNFPANQTACDASSPAHSVHSDVDHSDRVFCVITFYLLKITLN